jgi:hypothetical protein
MDRRRIPGLGDVDLAEQSPDLAAMNRAGQQDTGQHLLPPHAASIVIRDGEGDHRSLCPCDAAPLQA